MISSSLKFGFNSAKNNTFYSNQMKQRGQALVVWMFVIPILFIALLTIYNVGTAVRQKMSLQNTADATTYSAALVYARTLNFTAYTNRAMAANEAGIASVASMQTTAGMVTAAQTNHYTQKAMIEMAKSTAWKATWDSVPKIPFGPGGKPEDLKRHNRDYGFAKQFLSDSNKYHRRHGSTALVFQVAADIQRVFNYGIASGQQAAHAAALIEMNTVIAELPKINDPTVHMPAAQYAASLAAFNLACTTFTKLYWDKTVGSAERTEEQHDEAMRFAHVAKGSLDLFSKKRVFLPAIGAENTTKKAFKALNIDWSGGTALVSEDGAGDPKKGRIRWQAADRLNVMSLYNVLAGDNYTWLLAELVLNPDKKSPAAIASILSLLEYSEGVFGVAGATATQGTNKHTDSWVGNELQMASAIAGSRTYGDINASKGIKWEDIEDKVNESIDKVSKTDTQKVEIKKLIKDAVGDLKGFKSAAFYRTISRADLVLTRFDILKPGDNDVNNTNALALTIKSYSQAQGPAFSAWRYDGTRPIGTLTKDTHMPFFRDVAFHPQSEAFETDKAVSTALTSFNSIMSIKNLLNAVKLSNRGPSLTLLMAKKANAISFSNNFFTANEMIPQDKSSVKLNDKMNASEMKVLSSAGVYFRRPQDHWGREDAPKEGKGEADKGFTGGYIEHKNLFSPYWHVRNEQPWLITKIAAIFS